MQGEPKWEMQSIIAEVEQHELNIFKLLPLLGVTFFKLRV